MSVMYKVGMADLKVCSYPDSLTTLGLGSCVGIALYDTVTKTSGLLHYMLPDSTQIRNNSNIAKFGDTGLTELLRQMVAMGARRDTIVAKIAGGAQMFANMKHSDMLSVGQRNVEAAIVNLRKHDIPLLAQDTGENFGRTIELHSLDGTLVVKAIGKEIIKI